MIDNLRIKKRTFLSLLLACSVTSVCDGWSAMDSRRGRRSSANHALIAPLRAELSRSREEARHHNIGVDQVTDRRELFRRFAVVGLASCNLLPATRAASAKSPPVVTTRSVCDATVSVWRRGNDERLVYLLGTAHISQVSADLAGSLVDDVHPNAVFVELDPKRIGQVTKSGGPAKPRERVLELDRSGQAATSNDSLLASNANTNAGPRVVVPFEVATEPVPVANKPGNWLQRRAMNFATRAVGNTLRAMYSNLNDVGFNPGEEFATAMREGTKVGASIVLGDQDVEVTLRKLTEALAKTDVNRVLDPDSGYEQRLAALLPAGGMEPQMKNYDDPAVYKKDLTAFVEQLKSRDTVRKVIGELNEVAPALVDVMLTQRDAYMARGIDTLNEFDVIVAVMGIAHQDGVEANLREKGWRPVRLPCPAPP